MVSADFALAGVTSRIPPDEVIDAMYRIGQCDAVTLGKLREGGFAATPTGKII